MVSFLLKRLKVPSKRVKGSFLKSVYKYLSNFHVTSCHPITPIGRKKREISPIVFEKKGVFVQTIGTVTLPREPQWCVFPRELSTCVLFTA